MSRIANYVIEHSRLAWVIAVMVILAITLLSFISIRNFRELERLDYLKISAERCRLEILSLTMNGNQMGALGLLGLIDERVKREALGKQPPNGPELMGLMECFARSHSADGAYIVGQDGIIKASWGVGKPLTGVNVNFRPYTKMALDGKESVYAAIGTTTGRRTLYFASPIHVGTTEDSPSIGAAVARSSVEKIDSLLDKTGNAMLISPQGLVFSASRPELVGLLTEQLTPELLKSIRTTKQFGTMFDDKEPELLPVPSENGLHQFEGRRHALASVWIPWNDPLGQWKLVLMEDLSLTVPFLNILSSSAIIALVLFLIEALFYKVLRNHHSITENHHKLEAFAKAQEAAANSKTRVAKIALHLQQSNNIEELSKNFFGEAHDIFEILQGTLYLFDGELNRLFLAGRYACYDTPPESLEMGEGLVGQCAIERKTQIIETQQNGFMMIRSGLGSAQPESVMIVPILLNEIFLGVLEVALLHKPATNMREQFEEMTGLLAMNIRLFAQRGGN